MAAILYSYEINKLTTYQGLTKRKNLWPSATKKSSMISRFMTNWVTVNKSKCANGSHCMHLGKEKDTVAAGFEFVKHELEEGELSAGFD